MPCYLKHIAGKVPPMLKVFSRNPAPSYALWLNHLHHIRVVIIIVMMQILFIGTHGLFILEQHGVGWMHSASQLQVKMVFISQTCHKRIVSEIIRNTLQCYLVHMETSVCWLGVGVRARISHFITQCYSLSCITYSEEVKTQNLLQCCFCNNSNIRNKSGKHNNSIW